MYRRLHINSFGTRDAPRELGRERRFLGNGFWLVERSLASASLERSITITMSIELDLGTRSYDQLMYGHLFASCTES